MARMGCKPGRNGLLVPRRYRDRASLLCIAWPCCCQTNRGRHRQLFGWKSRGCSNESHHREPRKCVGPGNCLGGPAGIVFLCSNRTNPSLWHIGCSGSCRLSGKSWFGLRGKGAGIVPASTRAQLRIGTFPCFCSHIVGTLFEFPRADRLLPVAGLHIAVPCYRFPVRCFGRCRLCKSGLCTLGSIACCCRWMANNEGPPGKHSKWGHIPLQASGGGC